MLKKNGKVDALICVTNGRIVLEERVLENGVLLLDGERIAAVGQQGQEICRCLPKDGQIVMKFVNMVKAFHAMEEEA